MNDGWNEYDVREALRKSPEFREKNTMTRQKAEEMVTRAYRNVLGRDPDPAGIENYVQGVLRKALERGGHRPRPAQQRRVPQQAIGA